MPENWKNVHPEPKGEVFKELVFVKATIQKPKIFGLLRKKSSKVFMTEKLGNAVPLEK